MRNQPDKRKRTSGDQLLLATVPRTRTLLTRRRHWRKRVSVRRRASGRAHYNYFRDYDPALGRYVQSDPIGLKGGLSTYLYALADPNSYDDPRGQNAGVRYGIQGAGIGIGAALACAFNPDLCRTIIKLVCKDIVDFATGSDAEDDCENAEDECFAECEHLLGQGGRSNQGEPYRSCRIRCLKRKGCYKGDMAVE
jgi:RHS repeat-associated protein